MILKSNKNINSYTFINEEKEKEAELNSVNLEESPFIFTFFMINQKVEDVVIFEAKLNDPGEPSLEVIKCKELESYYCKTYHNKNFHTLRNKIITEISHKYNNNTYCLKYNNTILSNSVVNPGFGIVIKYREGFKFNNTEAVLMKMHYLHTDVYVNNYFKPLGQRLKVMGFTFETKITEHVELRYKKSIIEYKDSYFTNDISKKINF